MWKGTVERGRPQWTIWRMRTACWITKPTRTHAHIHTHTLTHIHNMQCLLLFHTPMVAWTSLNVTFARTVHCFSCVTSCTLFLYLLTPWCRVLLEQLTGLQLVKKFPAFHGTRMFITSLTSVRHLSVSWASSIQSIYPHPTSWRSILILSTHLRLGLPSGLFPFGFPTKTLYTPLSSPIRATCPAHLILLDFITRTILGEEYKSLINY